MKTLKSALLLTVAIIVLGTPAFAAVINSAASGLVAPQSTVTFSEFTFADTTSVSTEWLADFGLTISPNMNWREVSAWEAQGINGPNLRSGDPIVNPFSMQFTQTVSSAAFASIASPVTQATITAKLNGVDVESFTTEVNLENNSWYGFTGIEFNEIEVAYAAETRLRIDNVQRVVIPEPSTAVLAALGLLGFARRRRRK